MTSGTGVRSNVEIVREYTRQVFNEHDPDLGDTVAVRFVVEATHEGDLSARIRPHGSPSRGPTTNQGDKI